MDILILQLSFALRRILFLYLLFSGSLLFADEKKESSMDALQRQQGKKAYGFDSAFIGNTKTESSLQKKPVFFEKKFETESAAFSNKSPAFDKKFEQSPSSFIHKTSPIESKSYSTKSIDLSKDSSFQKRGSDLLQKNTSEFDKKFETKAYTGPETPQYQKELREILNQKGENSTLSKEEVKQIVNRGGHITSTETPRVEVPKESANGSKTSTR